MYVSLTTGWSDWRALCCYILNEVASNLDFTWDEVEIEIGSPKWIAFIRLLCKKGWTLEEITLAVDALQGYEIPPPGSLTVCDGGLGGALTLQDMNGALTCGD